MNFVFTGKDTQKGRAIGQAVSRQPRGGAQVRMGFVVDKVAPKEALFLVLWFSLSISFRRSSS
jgi:hypothetical protein